MKSIFIRLLFASVLLIFGTMQSLSQVWNTARLNVLYGSTIAFNFNNINRIRNGIEINPGIHFGISMSDSARVGHTLQGFVLNCRAFNGQTEIKGDSYSLPLNKIRIKAENIDGLGAGTTYPYQDLSTNWVTIFSFTQTPWSNLTWSTDKLNILLECGKVTEMGESRSLLGEAPDFYQVEIEFELVPTGIGF